jgi:hypothetical protein
MPTLQEVRQQYPQYQDMPDAALADALYKKFYADMPREQFDAKLGISADRSVMGQLTGSDGRERYQTWPERLVRGIGGAAKDFVALPGRVMQEAQQSPPQISDSDVSVLSVPQAMNFAGFASPINPAVRAGDKAIPGAATNMVQVKTPVPTTQELAKVGGDQLNAARESGLELTPNVLSEYAAKVKNNELRGIHPVDAPATYRKLADIENAPSGSFVTAGDLRALRDSLGTTAQNFNPQAARDQLAASRAIGKLDELLPSVDPKNVLAGNPAATHELFQKGSGNYAAAMRSNDITGKLDRAVTGIVERAENRAQASHSGRNLDNTIRQKVASALEKPKEVSGFSDAELGALQKVIDGGKVQNFARSVGNKFGGGGGSAQTVIAALLGVGGAQYGGMPGAIAGATIPTAVGASARSLANALAKRSLNSTDEMIRMRSPLYQEAAARAGKTGAPTPTEAALIKALLGMQLQPQQ